MSIEREKLMDLVKSLAPNADGVTLERIVTRMEKYNQYSIGLIIKEEMAKNTN